MTTGRDYSLGSHWTSVEEVIAAARARGVFLMVWSPDGLDEHREVLLTTDPDVVWAVRRSREQHGGWISTRLAPDGTDAPGTFTRLAPAGASGPQVIGARVDAETAAPA